MNFNEVLISFRDKVNDPLSDCIYSVCDLDCYEEKTNEKEEPMVKECPRLLLKECAKIRKSNYYLFIVTYALNTALD